MWQSSALSFPRVRFILIGVRWFIQLCVLVVEFIRPHAEVCQNHSPVRRYDSFKRTLVVMHEQCASIPFIYHPMYTILQPLFIKVDDKPQFYFCQPQVSKQLFIMHR